MTFLIRRSWALMVSSNSTRQLSSKAITSAVERLLDISTSKTTTLPPDDSASLDKGAQRMRVTLTFILAGFVTIWLLCVGLVWHMRVNRAGAIKGDALAAKKVILPAFEPVLLVQSLLNGIYIIFLMVTLVIGFYDQSVPPLVLEMFYSGSKFMFVFVLVVMFQKSLSLPAIKRSIAISLALSYYTVLYVWAVTTFGRPEQQKQFTLGLQVVRSPAICLFVYAFVKPPSRATTRAIRELCVAAILFFLLSMSLMILIMNPKTVGASHVVVYVMLSWVALCPLVIWRVLKADTEYWRGIGQRACALQNLSQRGNDLSERISSQGLHVLIEMNRKCVIDFAYLELVRQLGVGSESTVFQGTLKSKTHVAIKAYTPTVCSEEIVAAFSHEAALSSVLDHPNIVKFYGMCVAPPTICLVFQLCQGSLDDILHDQARHHDSSPTRQQLLISVGYMLDAARAVAYLHSFSPPFVHRGIKPTNFLVDAECNVQLSDFGESRSVGKFQEKNLVPRAKVPVLEDKKCILKRGITSSLETTLSLVDSPYMNKVSPEYDAPEILDSQGGEVFYGEASDVYSLTMTMQEILHPSDDKEDGDHAQMLKVVPNGARPGMTITNIPPKLRDIMERSSQRDPGLRPSAKQLVAVLEDIHEELCARLALELISDLVAFPSAVGSNAKPSELPGNLIVDRMLTLRAVRSPAEATRMGNALMDSGVLHHINHSMRFENTSTALYYLDMDHVHLILPTHTEKSLNRSSSIDQNESNIPMLTRGSNAGQPRTSSSCIRIETHVPCQCRQLGQRLLSNKSSRTHRRRQFKAAPESTAESNLLTAALLVGEESSHEDNYHSASLI